MLMPFLGERHHRCLGPIAGALSHDARRSGSG